MDLTTIATTITMVSHDKISHKLQMLIDRHHLKQPRNLSSHLHKRPATSLQLLPRHLIHNLAHLRNNTESSSSNLALDNRVPLVS